jgi:hypothetical protein
MLPLTAAAGALSYLTSFLQSSTASNGASSTSSDPLLSLEQTLTAGAGGDQSTTSPAAGGSGASSPALDPGMLAALLAMQSQQTDGSNGVSPSGLLSKLDTDGDGQISKTEFESALGSAGVDTSSADALFNKLDADGNGSISQSELSAARHGHGHHHHHMGGAGQSGGSQQGGLTSLLDGVAADGSTSQTTTNADGSSTTTISYADGSTVDMTIPAATQNGGSSNTSNNPPNQSNLLEQLIRLQSQFATQSESMLSTFA